jgi:hypothetical protein
MGVFRRSGRMTLRETALVQSVALGGADEAILHRALQFARFLQGADPVALALHVGPARRQNTTVRTFGSRKEATMAQLHDDEQFDVSVEAKDSKGFDVPDTFTATIDDESVATVTSGEDGRTFTVVAGNPGSAVLTVTDGTLSATLAVDVVPGSVALINLTAGEPVHQA